MTPRRARIVLVLVVLGVVGVGGVGVGTDELVGDG